MAFPVALALTIGQSLLKGGGGQQGPSFQIPQFNPGLSRDMLQRNALSLLMGPTGSGTAPDATDVKKGATKDFIMQAFLGNLIDSAFRPSQPAQTFTPPVFR